jgi:hypothetical protein
MEVIGELHAAVALPQNQKKNQILYCQSIMIVPKGNASLFINIVSFGRRL